MATIKIEGVIVYDAESRQYSFKDWLKRSDFTDGVFAGSVSTYVFVCEYTATVPVPNSLDLITPQLHGLDRQEADLAAKYQAAKTEIAAKRQSLLAIECAVQS